MYGISNLPPSLRKRKRLDRHADLQRSYKSRMKAKRAPDREDFGRAALAYALWFYHTDNEHELSLAMRRAILGTLIVAGFDPHQASIRYARMSERVRDDMRAWKRRRRAASPTLIDPEGEGNCGRLVWPSWPSQLKRQPDP